MVDPGAKTGGEGGKEGYQDRKEGADVYKRQAQGLGADALPVVGNLDHQALFILLRRQGNGAAGAAVLHRVGDEVVQHPLQLSPVGGDDRCV